MKHCIKKILVMSALLVGTLVIDYCAYAKVRSIESHRDLEQHVAKKGICVALFYNDGDKKDSALQKKNKNLKRMFEDVSATPSYDNADLIFIKINCARSEFNDCVDQYNITTVPTIMVFRDGRHLTDAQGRTLMLSGFVAREALETLINTHCGMEIKTLNVAKNEAKERRLKEEKSSWLPYFYPRDIVVSDYDPAERDME